MTSSTLNHIYFGGIILSAIIFFSLNRKYKWITQNNTDYFPAAFFGCMAWPIAILIIICSYGINLIHRYILPKD